MGSPGDLRACSSCSSHVKPTKSSRRSDNISHKSHNSTRNDKIQAVIASYKTRPKAPKPSTPEDSALPTARMRPKRNLETRGSGTSKPSSSHIRPDLRHLNTRRLKTRRFMRLGASCAQKAADPGTAGRRSLRPLRAGGPGETLRQEAPEQASRHRLI